RPDIAGAFAGFSNTAAAGGHFTFDWSTLTNGPHTIGWLVTDDCGRADGIGSRYFTVVSGTELAGSTSPNAAFRLKAEATGIALGASGFNRDESGPEAEAKEFRVKLGDRLELPLPRGYDTAYQVVRGERRDLPIGSTWDPIGGAFYWQPAPGFLG